MLRIRRISRLQVFNRTASGRFFSTEPPKPPTFFQKDSQPLPLFQNPKTAPKPLQPTVIAPAVTPAADAAAAAAESAKEPMSFGRKLLLFSPIVIFTIAMLELSSIIGTEKKFDDVEEALQLAEEAALDGHLEDSVGCLAEALELMDEHNVEHISEYYISCSLRLAQLLEAAGANDKALVVYEALHKELIHALLHSENYRTLVRNEKYDKVIAQCLLITLKISHLVPVDQLDHAREKLLYAIVVAQNRILENYPVFMLYLNDTQNRNIISLIEFDAGREFEKLNVLEKRVKQDQNAKSPIELPLYTTNSTPESEMLVSFVEGWPIFTDALTFAKNRLADISIQLGDLPEATTNWVSNTIILKASLQPPALMAITLTKMALTLIAANEIIAKGKSDVDLEDIMKSHRLVAEVQDHDLVNDILDSANGQIRNLFTNVLRICDQVNKFKLDEDASAEQVQALERAETMFQSAIDTCQMVASMGLGVLESQENNQFLARKHFSKALQLAKKTENSQYSQDASEWLAKLK